MIVKFKYKNHRGEITPRTVDLDSIEFITKPGYGYQPGWFLSGIDQDKNARRSFSVHNIILDDDLKLGQYTPNFRISLK
jgi:hypothetical protein